eukprot:12891709-Prorocentrum_lima.AAC.1
MSLSSFSAGPVPDEGEIDISEEKMEYGALFTKADGGEYIDNVNGGTLNREDVTQATKLELDWL